MVAVSRESLLSGFFFSSFGLPLAVLPANRNKKQKQSIAYVVAETISHISKPQTLVQKILLLFLLFADKASS